MAIDNYAWNWCVDELPTFRSAQIQGPKALRAYWPGLNLRFLGAFPHYNVPSQPGQPDIRKKLKYWFNNHGRPDSVPPHYKPVDGNGPVHPAHQPQNMPAPAPAPANAPVNNPVAPPAAAAPPPVTENAPQPTSAGTPVLPPAGEPASGAVPTLEANTLPQPATAPDLTPNDGVPSATTSAAAASTTSDTSTLELAGPSKNGEPVSIIGTPVPVLAGTTSTSQNKAPAIPPKRTRTKKKDDLFGKDRKRTPDQVYYDLFYDKVIAPEARKSFNGLQDTWLKHSVAVGKTLFTTETPAVRARCEAISAGLPDPWGKPEGMSDEEYQRIAKLERMERVLDAAGIRFGDVLDEFCNKLEGEAVASLFVAARQPSKGGEVQTFAWHTQMPDGRNFTGIGDFRESVKAKHKEYAQAVFPSHLAAPWALPGTEKTYDMSGGPSRAGSVVPSRSTSLAPHGRIAPSREQSLALERPETRLRTPELPDSLPPTPPPLPPPSPFPSPETPSTPLPESSAVSNDVEMERVHLDAAPEEEDPGDWEDADSEDEYPGIPKTRDNGVPYADIERKRLWNIARNKALAEELDLRHAASTLTAGAKAPKGTKGTKGTKGKGSSSTKPGVSMPARPRPRPVPRRTMATRRSGRIVSPSSPLVNEIVQGEAPTSAATAGDDLMPVDEPENNLSDAISNEKEDGGLRENAHMEEEVNTPVHAPSTPKQGASTITTPSAPRTPNALAPPVSTPTTPTPPPKADAAEPQPQTAEPGGAGVLETPQWFREYSMFLSDAMNSISGETGAMANTKGDWTYVEMYWEMHERGNKFELGRGSLYRIGTTGRPALFQKWQGGGRKDKETGVLTIPAIEDVSIFGEEVRHYWMLLQPSFRRPHGTTDWPPLQTMDHDEVEWEELRKYGTSGLLVILLLIVWWRKAIKKPRERKEWAAFVHDVSWALSEMVRTEKEFKSRIGDKRVAVEEAASPPASKRPRSSART